MKNLLLSLLVVIIAVIGHNPFVDNEKQYPVYEPPASASASHTGSADASLAGQKPAVPRVMIPEVPRLALYPLIVGPDLLAHGAVTRADIAAKLEHAHSTLGAAFGSAATITLVDRDAQTHPLAGNTASPERAALASSLPADYVLSGRLDHDHRTLQLRLQLSHVPSMRLIATMTVPLDSPSTFNDASIVARFSSAIDEHLQRVRNADDINRFRLSVAAFLPARSDRTGNRASRDLSDAMTDKLLARKRYPIMAGDHAMALGLETRLARHEAATLKPDVIVHGRLIAESPDQSGYDLVLFIERVGGLRSTLTLHADTRSALINQAVSAIDTRLTHPAATVNAKAQAESQKLLKQAWLEIFSNDSPRSPIASFPYRITDKNRDNIHRMIELTDQAILKDPQNFHATGARALASALTGDRQTEYRLLQTLMWDPRRAAFDHAVAIMQKHFHRGTTFYISGDVDGLPGVDDEQSAINQLLASRLLKPWGGSGDSPRYGWGSPDLLRYKHDERAVSQYLSGTHKPIIDDWARFKLMAQQQPIPTAHAQRTDGVTGSLASSYYYSLANASAPIMLNLGANGFYSAPVDVEVNLQDGTPLRPGQVFRYLNLIGKSMLADGNNIEADLLYASMMCEYDVTQCGYSQLIYQDIQSNAEHIRRRIVGAKDRYGKKRLVADGLIDMASRSLRAGHLTAPIPPRDKPTPFAAPVHSVPAASPNGLQLRNCVDCPDFIDASLISSPDGRWQIDREPYFDGAIPIRPELMPQGLRDHASYTRARTWLFANQLIDLHGMPTQRSIPTDLARRDLPTLFPGIGNNGVSQFARGYRASRDRRNVGRVIVYPASAQGQQIVQAPDGYAGQEFGTHISIANRHLLVCDGHRNAYVYRLESDQWHFYRKIEAVCLTQNLRRESPAVINEEWMISYRLDGRISFFKDDGVDYKRQDMRQINDDFTPADHRGAAIEGIWLGENSLLVGTASRGGYRLHHYTLKQNEWIAAGSIQSAHHFSQIRFHNGRAWQLSDEHIIALRLDNGTLEYDLQIHIPDANRLRGNRSSILFLARAQSTQLVWASADTTQSIDVE